MKDRLIGLDALRGIAAIVVLVFHIDRELIPAGARAVDLFFVLSGFVLARTYEDRLRTDLSAGSFLVKRLRRLWPVYALGCALGLIAFLFAGGSATWGILGLALMLLFLPASLSDHQLFFLNGPGWSLSYELLGNVLHAKWFAKWPDLKIVAIYVLCSVAFVLCTIWQGAVYPAESAATVIPCLFRMLVSYLTGILVWRNLHLFPVVSPTLPVLAFPALILLVGCAPRPASDLLFIFLACPLLVAAAARGNFPLPRAGIALGAISYPLYALHTPILLMPALGILIAAAGVLAIVAPKSLRLVMLRIVDRRRELRRHSN